MQDSREDIGDGVTDQNSKSDNSDNGDNVNKNNKNNKELDNQEIVDDAHLEGTIHISEDVIVELVRKTIQGIANIQTAARLASKFGLGRKGGDGIKVVVENGKEPSIFIDVYVLVRYGQRIPDLAWDVQEKVKANLERYTGYTVKAVNINVQGIYIDDPVALNINNINNENA